MTQPATAGDAAKALLASKLQRTTTSTTTRRPSPTRPAQSGLTDSDGRPLPIRRAAPRGLDEAAWLDVKPTVRRELLAARDEGRWPITLHGPVGVGKSCASVCMFRAWQAGAFWYRLEQFVRDIQRCRGSKEGIAFDVQGQRVYRTESKLWEFASSPTALWCIDDFGTRGVSDSAFDIIFELIDRRSKRPTIITTNHDLNAIAELYDARVADRLAGGTVLKLEGQSRRRGVKRKV